MRPGIKWPNDVLLNGRKVVGILVELEAEVERVAFVIAGIGVNLNVTRASFPRALRAKASSLRSETGRRIDRAAFTGRLLAAFEARYGRFVAEGFARTLRAEWEALSCLTGAEVRIVAPEGELAGRVVGLDADGALRLRPANGAEVRVVAGEVTVRGGYPS